MTKPRAVRYRIRTVPEGYAVESKVGGNSPWETEVSGLPSRDDAREAMDKLRDDHRQLRRKFGQ